jgi:hypothetical protein
MKARLGTVARAYNPSHWRHREQDSNRKLTKNNSKKKKIAIMEIYESIKLTGRNK